MILECPNCETRYEIPVELPAEGRKVRCSSCQHIWHATEEHQHEPDVALPDFEDHEIVFKDEPLEEEAGAGDPDGGQIPEAERAHDNDASSENAMEQAFSAAIGGAKADEIDAPGDAPFGVEGPEEETESPPIVIGKAKKKRRAGVPGPAAAGWAALSLSVAFLVALSYFQRVEVVRVFPGAASLYERIGLPVNVRGLEFDKVTYSWVSSAGRPVLEVHGEILNVTSEPLKVPTVVFGLRTKEKVEVYQWAADVRSDLLPPHERTAFSAQIPTPPKSIRDVLVRFAKVR